MSQTIVSTPAAVQPGAPGSPNTSVSLRSRLADTTAAVRRALDGTPGRLRLVSGIAVVVTVLAAVLGGAALRERSAALDEARSTAQHLIQLQSAQINLVQADADATNAFLGFGLEPEAQRLDYITSLAEASKQLALAAQASPQDADTLGNANAALTRYAGYVSSARANNRQGLPVGANYLKTASGLLSGTITPAIGARSKADTEAIKEAYSRAENARWWLVVAALLGLGVLLYAQYSLARHSRRIVNVPLAASTAAVLVVLLLAAGAMAVAQTRADDVRAGALTDAIGLSASRVSAYDAKSSESLTLISRGSGTPQDEVWTAKYQAALASLPTGSSAARTALTAYRAAHVKIRKLDDAGNWDAAVKTATSTDQGSANDRFTAYAKASEADLGSKAAAAASGLDSAGNLLLPAGILVVLIGLLAALGAWLGVSLRLDEYR